MTQDYKILYVPPSGTTMHCQHSWIAYVDDTCVGHIHMQIEANQRIKFLDAWVHDEYRRQGIFRSLWETRWKFVVSDFIGYTVYAWCMPGSLPLLKAKGFIEGDACVYVERIINNNKPPYEQCFVSC